eukprot:390417-Prymnesium_polylepis.1
METHRSHRAQLPQADWGGERERRSAATSGLGRRAREGETLSSRRRTGSNGEEDRRAGYAPKAFWRAARADVCAANRRALLLRRCTASSGGGGT